MKRLAVGLVSFVLVFAMTGAAQAVPAGTLDPKFSGDGVASSPLLSNTSTTSVEVDAKNRVLVAGYDANVNQGLVLRYKANGVLDAAWGNRFMPHSYTGVAGLALVGTKTIVGTDDGVYDGYVERLNPNGTLDKTFGVSGAVELGMPLIDVGTNASGTIFALGIDYAGKASLFKIGPTGKSVTTTSLCMGAKFYASTCGEPKSLTVSPTFVYVGGWAPEQDPDSDSAVVGRFDANGRLDTSYGGGGYAWNDVCGSGCGNYSSADAVAVSPSTGEVTAVGEACNGYCPHDGPNFYTHFTAAGVLDWTGEADFGDCGGSCIHSSAYPSGVALQSGKIVIVGVDDGDACTSSVGLCFGLERLTATGAVDATFAGGQIVTTKTPVGGRIDLDVRIFNTKILVTGGSYVARYQG